LNESRKRPAWTNRLKLLYFIKNTVKNYRVAAECLRQIFILSLLNLASKAKFFVFTLEIDFFCKPDKISFVARETVALLQSKLKPETQ
jgi:hypothetical protein